ncbi:MAG: heparinase II/III family protein [Balneolaceae bacterium]|nr:heparinase II/III family protein [Balneolaceae bacterium]
MVDEEGQVPRSRSSSGKIIAHRENGNYVYTAGDATEAYGGRLDRFHRHILFVRPDYFVIVDDLETSGSSSTYQWLLHAVNEMEVDDENRVAVSSSGDARMTLRFLAPEALDIEQRTGFDPPVEDPETAPDQFHLTASTLDPASSKQFVSVIWVDRDPDLQTEVQGESESSGIRTLENQGVRDQAVLDKSLEGAELLDAEGGLALRVGDDLILWKEEGEEMIRAEGLTSVETVDVHIGHFRGQ